MNKSKLTLIGILIASLSMTFLGGCTGTKNEDTNEIVSSEADHAYCIEREGFVKDMEKMSEYVLKIYANVEQDYSKEDVANIAFQNRDSFIIFSIEDIDLDNYAKCNGLVERLKKSHEKMSNRYYEILDYATE